MLCAEAKSLTGSMSASSSLGHDTITCASVPADVFDHCVPD